MARKNGTDILLYVDGTAIGCMLNSNISVNRDMIDASCKDDNGYQVQLPGQISWEASSDALLDDGASEGAAEIFDALINGTKVTLRWDSEVAGENYYSGDAYAASIEFTAENESVTEYSVSFTGTGTISRTTN